MTPLLAALLNKASSAGHLQMVQTPSGFALHVSYFGMCFPLATLTYDELGVEPPVQVAEPEPAAAPPPRATGGNHLRLVP